ncbi:MAG: glycosyltransferase, partial [Coriobacteriales bacterium]|nr:glycosyltransferase [Coriobacteriales bacterium]
MEREIISNKVLRDRIIFFVVLAFALFYLGWRMLFSLPFGSGFFGALIFSLGMLLLYAEVLDTFQLLVQQFALTNKAVPPVPEVPIGAYPEIDIFITTIDEPAALLRKTINGCRYLHYPDTGKLRIHLLDDGKRPEIQALAWQLGINYLSRKESTGKRDYSSGISSKALMLNHALANTSAPLVVALNADTLPLHNFLMKTVPYFVENQLKRRDAPDELKPVELGFVQTAFSSYNPDLFQYNLFSEEDLPNEQDFFNKRVQIAHNASNSVIYCGTSAVLKRSALNAIGGFYTELDADGLG